MTPSEPTVVLPDWTKLDNAAKNTTWRQNKGQQKLYFFVSIIFVGQFLNGFDGTIIGGLQALPTWHRDLHYPDSSKIGLLNAVSYLVGICMGPINSYVADRWGRKVCLQFYAVTMMLGTVLGCCAGISGANGYALFVASKGIIGSGLTAALMTSQIMLQEITHPADRGFLAALYDCNWVLGNVAASWCTFGTSFLDSSWAWRIPYIIQIVPALYILISINFVPETPRFLASKGRYEEALRFFIELHGNGDPNDELVRFEYEEMVATLKAEKEAKSEKWSTLLVAKGNKHRLGLAMLMTLLPQLNGGAIISFYYTVILNLVGIQGSTKQTGIGAGLNMMAFAMQFIGAIHLKTIHRRTMVLWTWPFLMVSMAGIAASGAVFANSGQLDRAAGIASVAMVWVFSVGNNWVQPLFYAYPAEVLNYSIRGKGMAAWNTANQASGAFSAYVNSIALDKIGWKYYVVYIPVQIVQWVLAYIYMVETRGYTLEEIALAFEGGTVGLPRAREEEAIKIDGESEKKEETLATAVHVLEI